MDSLNSINRINGAQSRPAQTGKLPPICDFTPEIADTVDLKSKPLSHLMRPHDLKSFIRSIPKVDLHRHLEGDGGSKDLPSTIISICKRRGIELPTYDPEELKPYLQVGEKDKTLLDFLSKFQLIGKVFTDRETVEEVTYQSIKAGNKDNVKYMELRFSPLYMASSHGMNEEDVMEGVLEGVKKAKKDFDTDVGLIMIVERQMGVESAAHVAEMAKKYMDRGVVALDLANDEYNNPPDQYEDVFRDAKKAGLKITVHAAETPRKFEDLPLNLIAKPTEGNTDILKGKTVQDLIDKGFRVKNDEKVPLIKNVTSGAYNARVAIEKLQADRIGHGVRIQHDEALMEEVRQRGIPLEMCPTSNVQTGAAESLEKHPFKKFYDKGIKVTINTDDPGISDIDLSDDYVKIIDQFGFTAEDIGNFIMNGIDAAFLPEGEKSAMKEKYQTQLDETFNQYIFADKFGK